MAYGLNEEFERVSVYLAVTSKSFWQRVAHRMDPDEVALPMSKSVLKLCREVAHDHGWPTSETLIQRACLWMSEGKLPEVEVLAISEFLEIAPGPGWDPERVIVELVEPVRRHWQQQIAQKVVERYKNCAPFGSLLEEMAAHDRLGESMADVEVRGSEIGEDTEEVMESSPIGIHMPTGIAEIDSLLQGGPHLGSVITLLGDSGAGKSMTLSFLSAVAAMHGENVGYLALEGEDATHHSRIMAAIVGVPIDDLKVPSIRKDVLHVWRKMRADGRVGRIIVNTFEPGSLSPPDVIAWFKAKEREKNIRIRFRVVDYGDLVAAHGKVQQESKYSHGEAVWRAFVSMAQGEDGPNGKEPNWVYTASQSKRPDWKPGQPIPMLTRAAVADSIHKVRLSDEFITLTPQPDMSASAGYLWYIDKDRHYGKTGICVGPVPHMRHMGRMADISHLG